MFNVTYCIVTPESAELGDYEEIGFAHPNGMNDALEAVENAADYKWRLSSIVHRFGTKCFDNAGRWFDTLDADHNYQTGAETRYSVHPPENISAASYARLQRILCYRAS